MRLVTWIIGSLFSALFLGLYDILKKRSLIANAVIPTLFISVVVSALFWLPWVILSAIDPASLPSPALRVDDLEPIDHVRLFAKSVIVAISWILSYFALKQLPISIAAPIRATSPFWTLIGAVFLLQERPSGLQWIGIGVTLGSFVLFSLAGRKEGIRFEASKSVWLMIGATLIGACSALYDRVLLGEMGYSATTVQAYFSLYLVVALFPVMLGWWKGWWPRGEFRWRWSIPLIGLSLLAADYVYFDALTNEDALISVVSCIRRGGALIGFAAGYLLFGERNFRRKTPCAIGIVVGIAIIALS